MQETTAATVVHAAREGLAVLHARFPASTVKAAIAVDARLGAPGEAPARLAPHVADQLVNATDDDWGRLLATLAAGDDEAEQIARALWDVNAVFWLPDAEVHAAHDAVFGAPPTVDDPAAVALGRLRFKVAHLTGLDDLAAVEQLVDRLLGEG